MRLVRYAAVTFLCLAAAAHTALAVPTFRYDPQTNLLANYQSDLDGWAALVGDPMYRSSFDAIFTADSLSNSFSSSASSVQSSPDRALDRHERRAMRSLYNSLASAARSHGSKGGGFSLSDDEADAFGGAKSTGNGDLLGELNRTANSLFATAVRARNPAANGNDSDEDYALIQPEQSAQTTGQEILTTHPQKAAATASPGETTLGSLGLEAMHPILRMSGMVAESLHELRQFVLIEHPKSSQLMMLDNRSSQALVMQTNVNFTPSPDLNRHDSGNHPLASPAQDVSVDPDRNGALSFLNKPLKQLLWDILGSSAAFLIYSLLFVAWLTWRKVISRHI
ncbi:hypothetical protein [Govanella unica]|uniref:Uncharacterized protein n=1 Tax=Govanella unica TaxID=2975056 RepID=A0A9X3TXM6_9PROT|nr:hypothetical protein [Govania unica]MDA5193572.1 hypothetical protein [Govania unica]